MKTRTVTFYLTASSIAFCQSLNSSHFLHFKIDLPTGFALVQIDRPMMDFNLYELRSPKGKVLARIYAGNHPNINSLPAQEKREELCQGVSLAKSTPGKNHGDLLLEFNGLLYKAQTNSPWSKIHVYDITNDPALRQTILSIFDHIQISNKHIN